MARISQSLAAEDYLAVLHLSLARLRARFSPVHDQPSLRRLAPAVARRLVRKDRPTR